MSETPKQMLLIESDHLDQINKRIAGLEGLLEAAKASRSFDVEVPIERKEFARIINMPVATLDRQRKQGLIPSYKFGGKVYIFMSEFIAALTGKNPENCTNFVPKRLQDVQTID